MKGKENLRPAFPLWEENLYILKNKKKKEIIKNLPSFAFFLQFPSMPRN